MATDNVDDVFGLHHVERPVITQRNGKIESLASNLAGIE